MFDIRQDLNRRLARRGPGRSEIRRRALRVATAVAAGATFAGCGATDLPVSGATAVDGASHDGGGTLDAAGQDVAASDVGEPDASAVDTGAADTGAADTAVSDTAGDDGAVSDTAAADSVVDDAAVADAAATDTAEMPEPECSTNLPWEEYVACCDEVNWDFDKGCMAWGPPAPPSSARLAELMDGTSGAEEVA